MFSMYIFYCRTKLFLNIVGFFITLGKTNPASLKIEIIEHQTEWNLKKKQNTQIADAD